MIMDSVLVFSIISLLTNTTTAAPNAWFLFLSSIPPFTLVPRFVLNLREIYARDVHVGRGSNMDTAFGFGTGFEQGAIRSAIVFAEPRRIRGEAEGEEMEMEVLEVDHTSGLV